MFHFILGLPWLVVLLRFILPLPWIWPAKALLAGVLLVASQQVLLNRISSGSVFAPEYPRPLIIVLNFLFAFLLLNRIGIFQRNETWFLFSHHIQGMIDHHPFHPASEGCLVRKACHVPECF